MGKVFLRGLYESANDGISSIEKLVNIHIKNLVVINSMGRISKNANKLLEYLEGYPIIDIKKTPEALNLTFNTISNIVNKFIEAGILIQKNQVNRNRIFVYQEYVDILKDGT